MCGIAGIVSENTNEEKLRAWISSMNRRQAHRGPDHDGIWIEHGIGLGHRRLSIIDLSESANQPFISQDGRYVTVYNGELYNFKELKLELQRAAQGSRALPYFFRTNSDTEVILASFLRWGKECMDHFNGMFSFAVWDRQEKVLFAARDRYGVKPFYYHFGNEGLIFASEIRAIIHSGFREFRINRDALPQFAMYQTVHAPDTAVKGIHMLLPGHYLEWKEGKAHTVKYYTLGKADTSSSGMNYTEVCRQVRDLLAHSVQRRMLADVPFGAFLSGGIDSSAVVGLMSSVSQDRVRTFNITFDESEFSESHYARQIARKFNTEHHEIVLRPEDFLKELPEALNATDHPGGDGSNTYIVSKATKEKGITMALSGIGGDELFAGYDVFKRMLELNRKAWINNVPGFARKAAASLIRNRKRTVGSGKTADLLSEKDITFETAYPLSRSLFTREEFKRLCGSADPFLSVKNILKNIESGKDHMLSAVSTAEISTYLQNVLLRDTDQFSMAVALEVREPFLDHRLMEFVMGIKDEHKYPHTPKKLLVDSLGDLLPAEIVNRPKMGFTLPWQHWMKNELKEFCIRNIRDLERKDLFQPHAVSGLWDRFLAGDPLVTWSRVWHFTVLNHWAEQNKIN